MALLPFDSPSQATDIALLCDGCFSAPCGRRMASADFHSTAVACCGGGFVPRFSTAPSGLAFVRIPPLLSANRSAPTTPSTGRAAIKLRRAGYVERWGSPSVCHCPFADHKISRCASVAACLSSPYRQRRLLEPLGRNSLALALARL
jgi:hypothetical protein